MPEPIRRLLVHAVIVVAGAVALTVLMASSSLTTPGADALSPHKRERVMKIAASKKGTPYRYGASGPRAFDCSGYTRWVYRKVGKFLPHNSAAQARRTKHIRKIHRKRGDLVFFRSGGHVYHVGIYAGHGRIWHAPRPGRRVHRGRIWTNAVSYGRVR
jgi:cell wall-associated NlpC family hydrolase